MGPPLPHDLHRRFRSGNLPVRKPEPSYRRDGSHGDVAGTGSSSESIVARTISALASMAGDYDSGQYGPLPRPFGSNEL